jgi:hypothetical protein
MKRTPTRIALALGWVLLTVSIVAVMSRSPEVVVRTNAVPIVTPVAEVTGAYEACQADEVLPAGTRAIRLSLEAMYGPSVRVWVARGGRTLTSGSQGSGWSRQSVTVPVTPLPQTVSGVSVCYSLAPHDELVYAKGSTRAGAAPAIRIEYLRPGSRSWLALMPSVARRVSFGRATSGVWIVLVVVAAMAALGLIVSWATVRDQP